MNSYVCPRCGRPGCSASSAGDGLLRVHCATASCHLAGGATIADVPRERVEELGRAGSRAECPRCGAPATLSPPAPYARMVRADWVLRCSKFCGNLSVTEGAMLVRAPDDPWAVRRAEPMETSPCP